MTVTYLETSSTELYGFTVVELCVFFNSLIGLNSNFIKNKIFNFQTTCAAEVNKQRSKNTDQDHRI